MTLPATTSRASGAGSKLEMRFARRARADPSALATAVPDAALVGLAWLVGACSGRGKSVPTRTTSKHPPPRSQGQDEPEPESCPKGDAGGMGLPIIVYICSTT